MTLDEIADLVGGKAYSNYVLCCCMFHDDRNPSMLIYSDSYYCKSCGARGATRSLIKRLDKSFSPNLTRKGGGTPWHKWLSEMSLEEFVSEAFSFLRRNAHYKSYLEQRKVADCIAPLKIGYWDGYFIVPVYDRDGDLETAVAIAGESKREEGKSRYLNAPGSVSTLYVPSWENLVLQNVIYVPFGIIDAITLYSLGLASATSITGKDFSPSLFDGINKFIRIIPDLGEEPAARNIIKCLGMRGQMYKFSYPEDSKDPNDLLVKHPQMLSTLSMVAA